MSDKELNTWELIKQTAETDEERLNHADIELNSLKKEQVNYDKNLDVYVDGYGKKYSKDLVQDQNNYVRAKAKFIIKENKIKEPNYLNKFMISKDLIWKEEKEKTNNTNLKSLKVKQKKFEENKKVFNLETPQYDIIMHLSQKIDEQNKSIQLLNNHKEKPMFKESGIAHPDILAINKTLYGKE
jgi:hypothetical protein